MDLEAMYQKICNDGGKVVPTPIGQPPIMFDSPEAEENFKRLVFEDKDLNEPLPTRTCSTDGDCCESCQ